jgi:poly-gamma-glutamate synthase PgsB/CapB
VFIIVPLLVFAFLVLLGIFEALLHRHNLSGIPIRIHVNGTRGKSSVTRLIAGGLRAGGITTCAKTTGTLARMILPDASEYPVFRPSGANVIEQVRIISTARNYGARAIVVECMALQPHLQWLSESRFLKSTHGVITNARPDHLDVMGPTESDVAMALAGTTPVGSKLFTAEVKQLGVFTKAAADRGTALFAVGPEEIAAVTDEEMERFPYVEHKENVALALRVCEELGIERARALPGMWKAPPDPGVMTISHIRFFGRDIHFVNAFAANDPQSTEQLWGMALDRFPDVEKRIAIFNCRADRPTRSEQLGRACVHWRPADTYLLMGSATYFFLKSAMSEGMPLKKMLVLERESESDIFEIILERMGRSALVMGMGNAKGLGLSLARFFRNRSTPREAVRKEVA